MSGSNQELDNFIRKWREEDESNSIKKIFSTFIEQLEAMELTHLDFVMRDGITYSLRAQHARQQKRPLFTMIDVIEGEPRWLSVCFYAEMIDDPAELGDFIPGGLLGEDAFCFDVTVNDSKLIEYLSERISDAHSHAAN